MPNIKPLRKEYKSVRELYLSENSPFLYKKLVNGACDGDELFIIDLDKASSSFNTFDDIRIKCLFIFTFSYGLKTNEKGFKEYLTKQYNKGSSSVFSYLINNDLDHIKSFLNSKDFQNTFKSIFQGNMKSANNVLTKLKNRISNIKSEKTPKKEEKDLLTALIDSLIKGKNIAPDGNVIEDEGITE